MSNLSNLPKLYTRNGDRGTTNLYDRVNLYKTDQVFEALGDLDELASHIGVLCSLVDDVMIIDQLREIQNRLLDMGSDLSTVTDRKREKSVYILEQDVTDLETYIDHFTDNCTPLRQFILSGCKLPDAQSHVCRSVCRRAERHVCRLLSGNEDSVNLAYLNRLSDYFFALSRYLSGCQEKVREIRKVK